MVVEKEKKASLVLLARLIMHCIEFGKQIMVDRTLSQLTLRVRLGKLRLDHY